MSFIHTIRWGFAGIFLTMSVFLPWSLFSSDPMHRIEIALHASSIIDGEDYTLGQIADISCMEPLLRENLAKVSIGRSPFQETLSPSPNL